MLRSALVPALLFTAGCFRTMRPLAEQQSPRLEKKAFGPAHRSCRTAKRKKYRDKVIGGKLVDDPDKFPFIAWLGDNDGTQQAQFCGGSLISDRIVLTAGHCLYNDNAKDANLLVRLKLTNFMNDDGLARDVINWKRHERFSMVRLFNDIALLLLNESVPAGLVRPLQISDGTKSFEHAGAKMVAGWGSTDEACGVYDTLLRESEVPFGTDGPTCSSPGSKTLNADQDYDGRSECCAGDFDGSKHYPGCGDSGGPLFARDGDWWSMVGVVSWTYGSPYPDVFTRVSYFQDWIKDAMADLLAAGEHPAVRQYGPPSRKAA